MYNGNNEITSVYLGSEEITKIYQGSTVVYEKGDIDYSTIPLTIQTLSDGTFRWQTIGGSFPKTIQYKLNGGAWTSITSATGASAPSLNLSAGDVIQFKGNNNQYAFSYANVLAYDGNFNVYGNIMSLIYEDDFIGKTSFRGTGSSYTYAFSKLFKDDTTLKNIDNLILPATSLVERCYNEMFSGCTSLTDVSKLELPTTTLANYCYNGMFYNCTSLTLPPSLPATTLANYCYRNMFYGCTRLRTAPELPATTLKSNCYKEMFNGCSRLSYIKCLATDISANGCTQYWVKGVAASGTFVTPSTTTWVSGQDGIPSGWARVNSD